MNANTKASGLLLSPLLLMLLGLQSAQALDSPQQVGTTEMAQSSGSSQIDTSISAERVLDQSTVATLESAIQRPTEDHCDHYTVDSTGGLQCTGHYNVQGIGPQVVASVSDSVAQATFSV